MGGDSVYSGITIYYPLINHLGGESCHKVEQRDELRDEGICIQSLKLYSLERLLPNHAVLPFAGVNSTNTLFSAAQCE